MQMVEEACGNTLEQLFLPEDESRKAEAVPQGRTEGMASTSQF